MHVSVYVCIKQMQARICTCDMCLHTHGSKRMCINNRERDMGLQACAMFEQMYTTFIYTSISRDRFVCTQCEDGCKHERLNAYLRIPRAFNLSAYVHLCMYMLLCTYVCVYKLLRITFDKLFNTH